jgi:hypothetical protein
MPVSAGCETLLPVTGRISGGGGRVGVGIIGIDVGATAVGASTGCTTGANAVGAGACVSTGVGVGACVSTGVGVIFGVGSGVGVSPARGAAIVIAGTLLIQKIRIKINSKLCGFDR